MRLTLLVLKDQTYLMAQVEILEMEPRVHMFEPMVVSGTSKVILTPWPKYTDEKHILINSNSLLTDLEPNEKVRDAYLAKIGKTLEDFTPKPQPELLQEDEQLPTGQFEDYEDDHGYEPRYQEEM